LDWKVQEWGPWVKTEPLYISRDFPAWRFETVSHTQLLSWHALFYPNPGPKQLQPEVVDLVDYLALAIWFMDDGSSGWWPRITFGMQPSSHAIALTIFERLGFKPRWEVCDGNTGNFHFEGEDQAERFIALITPHMPECMHYKLSFGFQGPQYQLRKKLTFERLKELVDCGTPIKRMAKILDEAPTTVTRHLERLGIEHPRTIGRPPSK